MADKFIGDSRVVEYGGVDISGKYTDCAINEEAPEANRIDVSDAGSTEIETVEGLRGEPKTTVNVSINDEVGGVSPVYDLVLNSEDTLVDYPEGKVHGKPMRTINNAVLSSRRKTGGYQTKEAWALSFYSYETVVDTTYSTV